MDGFDLESDQNAGNTGTVHVNTGGTLTTYGMGILGNAGGAALFGDAGSTMNLEESNIDGNISGAIESSGTVNMQNDTVTQNQFALDILQGSTFNAFNTLIADSNNPPNCENGHIANSNNNSLDDDGSCGVTFSNNTDIDNFLSFLSPVQGMGQDAQQGGPATTVAISTNSDTTGKGVSCPTVDGRFFANPVVSGVTHCDIGADTGGFTDFPANTMPQAGSATQDTTGPSCVVTGGVSGVSQNVTLSDPQSGFGPEAGLQTDNPSNVVATAYPPPTAVPVPGNDVTNMQITNGSVTFSSPTAPTLSPIVLTAGNKTTPGVNNSNWSFTGLNWAGVATNCH
jgi:hypothetical protein